MVETGLEGSQERENLLLRKQRASEICLGREASFSRKKRREHLLTAHICSPQPWEEGRPGGPAPAAGSSRLPYTPPGRQDGWRAAAAAALGHGDV